MLRQTKTLYAFEEEAFVDLQDLSLLLEEPAPDRDNPILRTGEAGEPDDGKLNYTGSVRPWRDGYGMWYQAEDWQQRLTRCFASSPDGFTWTKHGVIGEGLFNNLGYDFNVYQDGDRFLAPLIAVGTEVDTDSPWAPLQPADVPDERRRAMLERACANSGRTGLVTFVGVATSPDGLHWELPPPTPRLPMKLEASWLCRFQGRYIMNSQTNGCWFEPPHPAGRIVVFLTSEDLIHWAIHPQCMANTAHEAIRGQTHVGIVPIKRIDDRLLIGVGGRFDDGPELPSQHFEITLLYSTDGLDWKPVVPHHERRNWIRRGRRGEWDFGGVTGMGLVEHGDAAALYYSGTTIGNCAHSHGRHDPGPCQVGRVCFVRDRFAALQPTVGWNAIYLPRQDTISKGVLITRPLDLSSDRPLTLNVEIPDGATVEVEVLTGAGEVVDAASVKAGGVAAPVPLAKPPPQRPVQLRLTLAGPTLTDRVPRLFAIEY